MIILYTLVLLLSTIIILVLKSSIFTSKYHNIVFTGENILKTIPINSYIALKEASSASFYTS